MSFVLPAHGKYAEGRWVGLSYDAQIVTGYAALARSAEDAKTVAHRLVESGRVFVNADHPCEVVVTAPDEAWLRDLCRQLVDARLASSAHVVSPVISVYRWKGAVHEATEGRAFLRTRSGLVEAVVAFVVDRHPYEVPNVTALPIVGGNPAYLAWILRETAETD